MPLFDSSRRKLARAKIHLADLEQRIEIFEDSDPYETFTEIDPDLGGDLFHKIRLRIPFPDSIPEIIGDTVNNLREALDTASYSATVASGHSSPRHTYFPFAANAEDFNRKARRGCKHVPDEIFTLLQSFQPYRGGNDLLWSLNQICGANKHAMLCQFAVVVKRNRPLPNSKGYITFSEYRWDNANKEVAIPFTDPDLGAQCEVTFLVAFDEIEVVGGKEVVPVLNQLASMIEGILATIEGETIRLYPNAF